MDQSGQEAPSNCASRHLGRGRSRLPNPARLAAELPLLHLGAALVAAQGDHGGLGSLQLLGDARPNATLFC